MTAEDYATLERLWKEQLEALELALKDKVNAAARAAQLERKAEVLARVLDRARSEG